MSESERPAGEVECVYCGGSLMPLDGMERVVGWLTVRESKGFRIDSHLREYAHAGCVDRVKNVGEGQASLL